VQPSQNLIRKESPTEEAIRFCRGRIVAAEKSISDAIDRFVALEVSLDEFHETEYWPRVGVHAEELDHLRGKILGRGVKPDAVKRKQRPRAAKEKEQTAPPEEKKELKRLYRELAKRYHPDAAPHAKDKEYYQSRMAAVNEAFAQGDLRKLQRMFNDSKVEIADPNESDESRLEALKIDEIVLAQLLDDYSGRFSRLERSSSNRLMRDVRDSAQRGIDVLEEMAEGFKRRIQIYKDVFEGMTSTPTRPRDLYAREH